jgi:VWFA-related protein
MRSAQNRAIAAFIAFGFLLFVNPSGPCFAQTLVPPVPAQPGSVENDCSSTEGRRISIDVEVTGKSGRPVRGLEAGDFNVFDNNQPLKLLDFHAIDVDHPPAVPVHVLIIVDAVNADTRLIQSAREGRSEFLKQNGGKLAYPTSIALFSDSGFKVLQQVPTQDNNTLLASLNSVEAELREIGRSAGIYGAAERWQKSIDLISELSNDEATQSGRKLVLFLSSGWPTLSQAGSYVDKKHQTWIFDDIVSISNQLRQACVSLYTLDPTSIGTLSFGTPEPTLDFSYESFLKGVTKMTEAQYHDLAMQVLAVHSGGQVILGGNDVKEEIDTALRDATVYYNLGFAPAPASLNTQYHAIRIKVDKPGLTVRTTAGYYVKAR